MIEDTIARLTGRLTFEVSSAPLSKFLSMLKSAEASMARVGKSAEQMQAKLNKAFNVSSKAAIAEKAKLDSAVMKSQSKELATHQKIARLQHAQNTAALSAQKLVATGKREETLLQSASLKQQVTSAILAAKQQKVQQELLKTKLGEHKVQAASEQSQIRQARYAKILQERQAQTVRLQQQAAMHQTKFQRAEAALSNARASGIRQAERYKSSKLAAAHREARAQLTQERAAKRFDFSAERHTAWQARQAEQAKPQGMGFAGLTVGLGAAGAALYTLTQGIGYLNERITKRQETASDNQQFDNTLLAAGNNDVERARIKEAYISNFQEFGMKIDRESAVAYSNMVQGFRAQGKTLEEAIQLQKEQAAVFRIGNLDATQQFSARTQLNQGYGKDRFMGQDLRPLTDAIGTRLTTILYKAIGKALGYKGSQSKLAGFVLEAQHDGKVNGAMVQQGLRDIVAQSPELLERHKHSLDAQAVRVENDRYLQSESINRDPELIDALGERLTAERGLIESTKGLAESFKNADIGFVKMQTGILRLLSGKNADDTVMTPQEKAQQVALGGFPEGAGAIDPAVMGGGPKPSTGEKVRDPISMLYRWLTNTPDYEKGPTNQTKVWTQNLLGMQFNKLDVSRFGAEPPDETGQMKRFRPYQPFTAEDVMEGARDQLRKTQPVPTSNWLLPGDLNSETINKPVENKIDQSHTEVHNDITVNITTPPGADEELMGRIARDELGKALQTTRASQKENL